MKKIFTVLVSIFSIAQLSNAQTTTMTVNSSDVLTSNNKLVIETAAVGQIFFTGHQVGSGYTYPAGIFRAVTDNPTYPNYFFEGIKAGAVTYSIRSDGQGFFAGNVGIGTTAPNVPVHIFAGASNSLTTGLRLQGGEGSTTSASSLLFSSSYSAVDYQTGRIAAITSGWGADYKSDLAFYSNLGTSSGNLTEKMRITSSGNVGIGTTNPSTKLQVAGGNILLDNFTWYSSKSSSGTMSPIMGVNGNVTYVGDLFGNLNDNLNFRTSGVDRMFISAGGDVSIGVNSAYGYKLAVNGNMIANSVKVRLYPSWPDYVFKPTYNLPSLSDIKNYIDKNHHLPDMPSAKDVEKDGLNLGEINTLLTKKVEELTLYLIEENKQNKQQQDQINQLKKQLNDITKAFTKN